MVSKHGNKTGTNVGTTLSSKSPERRAKHLKAPCTTNSATFRHKLVNMKHITYNDLQHSELVTIPNKQVETAAPGRFQNLVIKEKA